ncbi:Hpt domain-containing protein [Candidatus Roizmanbacteria bacterium]|nr:MAG: Hpt domain-containing protein [Candidatus Roizmanbacteria bacterium]
MAIDLHEYKKLYLQTSQELLSTIKNGLIAMNTNPGDKNVLAEVHRAAHSFKSQSLVMGYAQLGLCGRVLEALFLGMKEGSIDPNAELSGIVNETLEAMDTSLANVRNGQGELDLSSHISKIENQAGITVH